VRRQLAAAVSAGVFGDALVVNGDDEVEEDMRRST
jgi:hypothetical protein